MILEPRRPPSPTPSGPTPLCPTPPPAATRPLLSRGTHPARGPRPPVRGHHRPYGHRLLSRAYPPRRPPPPGRCRQHRVMRAPPLRRVVTVGSCVYCVVRTAQPVRRGAGERSPLKVCVVCVLELLLYKARLLIPFFSHFTLPRITLSITLSAITLFSALHPLVSTKKRCNTLF